MPKSSNQKLKLPYLMKIMLEQTDEEHPITVPQIIEELAKYDISAERKSVYSDLEALTLFGLDIVSQRGKTHGYFVASRDFELPELKLLVDSVQSSKFITHKKSMSLISKIEKLTSRGNARKLHRQVFVTNRVKTLNEQIYYNVDKIQEAIISGKQISFLYFDINPKKQKVYRKDGGLYRESPVSLTWDDENYYMITYKERYKSFTHFRVDKMDKIQICDEDIIYPPNEFDLAAYTKTVFSMFGGEETEVTVKFENNLAGAVFDRFGTDIPIIQSDDEHFVCRIKVAVSPHFLSWIISFGNRAEIISPNEVVDQIKALLDSVRQNYSN